MTNVLFKKISINWQNFFSFNWNFLHFWVHFVCNICFQMCLCWDGIDEFHWLTQFFLHGVFQENSEALNLMLVFANYLTFLRCENIIWYFLPIQVRQLCLLSRTYIWNVFNEIQLFPSQDCSKTTFLIEPFRVNIECSVQTLFKWNMNYINWKYKWNIFEKVQFRALWSSQIRYHKKSDFFAVAIPLQNKVINFWESNDQ